VRAVLLVRDDPEAARPLRAVLESHDFAVEEAGRNSVTLTSSRPHLILLDLQQTDTDAVRKVRSLTGAPLIVLSAESDSATAEFLNTGADDVLNKPFGIQELLARIRVVLRNAPQDPQVFSFGDMSVDLSLRRVIVRGSELHLARFEYSILSILARSKGQPVSYQRILQEVWGTTSPARMRTLRVRMHFLRKKVEQDPAHPQFLFTDAKRGYRLGPSKLQQRNPKIERARV